MQRMQIRGMAALRTRMKQLPFNVAHNIGRGATKAAADLYRDHLQAEAPVGGDDEIHLRDEIHSRRRNSRGRLEAKASVNAGRAANFKLVEYGTSRAKPHPFARNIWDREKHNLFRRMEDYIRVRLKKAGIIR